MTWSWQGRRCLILSAEANGKFDMSRINVTRQSLREGVTLPPGKSHTLILAKKNIVVVEMDDLNFHFGSCVLLPIPQALQAPQDPHIGGLKVVARAMDYAIESGRPLLVAGHTDSVGSDQANISLSQKRSDNLLLFIQGDYAGWADSCADYRVEDYQLILKWIADFWSWDCDPGPVDNVDGPQTQRGLQRFSEIFSGVFNESLAALNAPSKDHWQAFARLYEQALMERVDIHGARAALNLLDPATLACGEHWPEQGQYQDQLRSGANRRVELLFFDDTDLPDFSATDPPGYDIYGTDLYFEREYLTVDPDYRFYFSL